MTDSQNYVHTKNKETQEDDYILLHCRMKVLMYVMHAKAQKYVSKLLVIIISRSRSKNRVISFHMQISVLLANLF